MLSRVSHIIWRLGLGLGLIWVLGRRSSGPLMGAGQTILLLLLLLLRVVVRVVVGGHVGSRLSRRGRR